MVTGPACPETKRPETNRRSGFAGKGERNVRNWESAARVTFVNWDGQLERVQLLREEESSDQYFMVR